MMSSVVFTSCGGDGKSSGKKKGKKTEFTLKQKMSKKMSEMSEMAELGTVEYTVKKVVKSADDKKWYQIGNRKILFNCTAYLKAGIDLSKFDASSVVVNEEEKSVVVKLPKAELLSFNMPPDKCVVEFEDVTWLRSHFTQDEKNRLLQLGEQQIRDAVPSLGILKDAEKNATSFFKSMLKQVGFESVTVKFE